LRKLIMGAAVALPLAFAGTAQGDTDVPSLTGPWSVTNPSVKQVDEGVQFGPYADGGAAGGTLLYTGGNDLKLSEVGNFSFTFSYNQRENWSGAVPYGRIWLDTNENGVWDRAADEAIMFDPSRGGAFGTLSQGIDHSFGTSDNSVRFNDDSGNGGQRTWDEVVAAHGDEDVVMVGVSAGFTGSTNVSAMLKKLTFNGETFSFSTPPADGTNGTNGVNGKDGAAGPAGAGAVPLAVRDNTVAGATLRTLHVRKIAGMKFISARASLRGKSVRTIRGRTIKVDLRGKSAGRYRVVITARYKAHGKVYKVRSTRSLRIVQK
jgi:hypothetical protein